MYCFNFKLTNLSSDSVNRYAGDRIDKVHLVNDSTATDKFMTSEKNADRVY